MAREADVGLFANCLRFGRRFRLGGAAGQELERIEGGNLGAEAGGAHRQIGRYLGERALSNNFTIARADSGWRAKGLSGRDDVDGFEDAVALAGGGAFSAGGRSLENRDLGLFSHKHGGIEGCIDSAANQTGSGKSGKDGPRKPAN